MTEGVVWIDDDLGFCGNVGTSAYYGDDFIGVWDAFEVALKGGADDAGLDPWFSSFEVAGGGEAGQFCTGAGATG